MFRAWSGHLAEQLEARLRRINRLHMNGNRQLNIYCGTCKRALPRQGEGEGFPGSGVGSFVGVGSTDDRAPGSHARARE